MSSVARTTLSGICVFSIKLRKSEVSCFMVIGCTSESTKLEQVI